MDRLQAQLPPRVAPTHPGGHGCSEWPGALLGLEGKVATGVNTHGGMAGRVLWSALR